MNRAIGLYPHVEKELSESIFPFGKNAVIRARNRLCETNQCMIADVVYSGMSYFKGREMK